jgi:putative addiction module component (TIGR02574 family)
MNASTTTDQLFEAVLALPRKDKEALAAILADDLDADEDPAEVKKAWDEEIKRRIESSDRGEVTLLTHEEVWQRLEAKHGKVED